MRERRKFVRLNDPTIVWYRMQGRPQLKERAVSKNISGGGLLLPIGERIEAGTKLELEINIPFDSMPVNAVGEVVRLQQIGKDRGISFEASIRFLEMDPFDRNRLFRYINDRLVGRGPLTTKGKMR